MDDKDTTQLLSAIQDAVPGVVDQAAAEAAGAIQDLELAKRALGAALSGARRWDPDPPLNLWEDVFQGVVAAWAGQAEPGDVIERCDVLRAHHLRVARSVSRSDCDAFMLGFWVTWTSVLLRAAELATLRQLGWTQDASCADDGSHLISQHMQIHRGIRIRREGM